MGDCCAADMVWSQERDADRTPMSVILPRLYLGAERDVTQVRTKGEESASRYSVISCQMHCVGLK